MIIEPAIVSIGTSVPEHKVRQESFLSFMTSLYPDSREMRLKMRRILLGSGIETRHSVLGDFKIDTELPALFNSSNGLREMPGIRARMAEYEKHAFPLSAKAVEDALNKASWIRPSEITHLVTFSCTGMYAPGIDMQLIEHFGIPTSAERFNINFMGCYAAFNALKTAYHICRSQPEAKVLLSGVELCSLHFNNLQNDDQLVANSIFGDGSSAVIVTASGNIPISDRRALKLNSFHADFSSKAKQQMIWNVGDSAFDLRLSSQVPDSINTDIASLVDKLLEKEELTMNDIDHYAIHPGGVRILNACEKGLQISSEKNAHSYEVLKNFGNMSSVTVLFVLQKYLDSFKYEDIGKNVLSCAFGPGLTIESLIAKVI
jgi:alpha-pyrone synthase